MTNQEKAKALYHSLDIDVLDALVVLVMQESLETVQGEDKISKSMIKVHNWFCFPDEKIKKDR